MKQKLLDLLIKLKPYAQKALDALISLVKVSPIPFLAGLSLGYIFHAELGLVIKIAEGLIHVVLKIL